MIQSTHVSQLRNREALGNEKTEDVSIHTAQAHAPRPQPRGDSRSVRSAAAKEHQNPNTVYVEETS